MRVVFKTCDFWTYDRFLIKWGVHNCIDGKLAKLKSGSYLKLDAKVNQLTIVYL